VFFNQEIKECSLNLLLGEIRSGSPCDGIIFPVVNVTISGRSILPVTVGNG
jgi:hypothetical protein